MNRNIESRVSGNPEAQTANLIERLEGLVAQQPDRFGPDVVGHVRQFVGNEMDPTKKGKNKRPYRFFTSIEDYQLYFALHPEWQGKTTHDLHIDHESGASSFYAAFTIWSKKASEGDQGKRREFLATLFAYKTIDWSSLDSLGAWQQEFERHQEWQEKSPSEMMEDTQSGGSAFYYSFRRWLGKQNELSVKQRNAHAREIFPTARAYGNFTNLDDWENEFNKHPHWQGKSASEVKEDRENDGNAFYQAFNKWVNKEAAGDRRKARELRVKLFHQDQNNWTQLETIEQWQKEFQTHPEWAVYKPSVLEADTKLGAGGFVASFRRWVNKQSKGDSKKRQELMGALFSEIKNNWTSFTTLHDWVMAYRNHPELQGLSSDEMRQGDSAYGRAFCQAFIKWAAAASSDKNEYGSYVATIFPKYKYRLL